MSHANANTNANTNADETEVLLRINRRSLAVLLAAILILGAIYISSVLWPAGVLAQTVTRMPWLLPMLLFAAALLLRIPLKGRTPQAPAVRALLDDEFRRTNLARAQ